MPDARFITITNKDDNKSISVIGKTGFASVTVAPKGSETLDMKYIQLDDLFVNSLLGLIDSSDIDVYLDGILLSRDGVMDLKYIAAVGSSAYGSALISAGRDSLVTNSYLRGPGNVPTNISGYYVPVALTIGFVTVSTSGNETWVAEVRKNGVLTPIVSLSIVNADQGYVAPSVNIDAGDEIQMYCNGTLIDRPIINVLVVRR